MGPFAVFTWIYLQGHGEVRLADLCRYLLPCIYFLCVPVCAGILRSCLASDTDSSTICLPAAQDASLPPTVLMFIDRVVHAKTQNDK